MPEQHNDTWLVAQWSDFVSADHQKLPFMGAQGEARPEVSGSLASH